MHESAPSTTPEKPSSSSVFASFAERRNAEDLTDEQRDEVNAEWKKFGGDAIDEAQKNINALNFKSNATDHVYAKAALRDARTAFYENYLAGDAVAEDAVETPSESGDEKTDTSDRERHDIINDEELSSWEKLHKLNELAAKIGKVASVSIEAAPSPASSEAEKADEELKAEPAGSGADKKKSKKVSADTEPRKVDDEPEEDDELIRTPVDFTPAPGAPVASRHEFTPNPDLDADIDKLESDLASAEAPAPTEPTTGETTDTTTETEDTDSGERFKTKSQSEKWAERESARREKRANKERAKTEKKDRREEKAHLRREKEIMDYVEEQKNPKIKKNRLGKLLRSVKGLPATAKRAGHGIKRAASKTGTALKHSISNDHYYTTNISTPDADADVDYIEPVPVNIARGSETPEEFAAREAHDLELAKDFLGSRADDAAESHETEDDEDDMSFADYSDGSRALRYAKPGTSIDLGPGSIQKYARDFNGIDMGVIKTESGKEFGIGEGYIINKETGEAIELTPDTIKLTVGKDLELPGVGSIGPVKSLVLRYKSGYDIDSKNPENPFTYYEKITRVKNERSAA